MAISFTPEQQRVIELHHCNILVSAAAGSGKTAVLVERIIQMVCDGEHPVDVDRLLIVTFTNAAAAEMRERIAAGIAARLAQNPESEHIQRQATLLHNAQITTIDSFCLFLLRNHFNEIGLDPAFRIADDGEIRLMQQEVLAELMEDGYREGGEAFRYCVEYFCPGGKERTLEQHILKLSRYAASFPWPAQWLEERKQDYAAGNVEEICESDYGRYLTRYLSRMVKGCAEKMKQVQRLCQAPEGPYMYGEMADQELEMLEELARCRSLADFERKLPAASFGRLSSKKDDSVSPRLREQAKALRADVKDCIQDLTEKIFATPLALAADRGKACGEPVCTLLDLVLDFDRRMLEKKREKKVIDFSDMEHFALDILLEHEDGEIRPSSVAREYRQHFAEILIDEYQDSNLVQEYLLQAVSGEEDGCFNRFMVGDVKQSIYQFRLARPELFMEKYNTYTPEFPESVSATAGDASVSEDRASAPSECISMPLAGCRRIDLSKNFRSRVQVVEAVNDVFSRIMSLEAGGIAYDERAALYPGAVYPEWTGNEPALGKTHAEEEEPEEPEEPEELRLEEEPGERSGAGVEDAPDKGGEAAVEWSNDTELILVDKPDKASGAEAKQAEARAIAAKIKKLREGFFVTDREAGGMRPARYSDMVILLRTNSGWDEEFQSVLEGEGIPVHITARTGYFAATEVQELLQLLRVLDNPRQDIPLFGVMRSVFGGFTEEEIALIRSALRDCSLYEALEEYAQKSCEKCREDSEAFCMSIAQKTADFLDMLRSYRACTVYLPIRELLTKLVDDFDYLDYVTALPGGSKRRANVEMLFTRASDFEKTSYFGLFHFVRYIEQLEKYDVDYGEAGLLDENADVVRIMSIHKSKGLEFPITFVAGLSKRFNMQDVNQPLIVDMDLGLAADYVDPVRRVRGRTLRRAAVACKLREDSLAEELRVLYVAMTRAKEKLILTAVAEDAFGKAEALAAERAEGVEKCLSYVDFTRASGFLDFLLPVISRTCVRISATGAEEQAAGELKEQVELSDKRLLLERAESLGDGEALERLRERLNAAYPYAGLGGLYTKTTVSELKIAAMADRDEEAYHTFEEKEVQPYIPAFRREEEKTSGAVRGSAFHRVMELLDFEGILGAAAGLDCDGGSDGDFPADYQEYSVRLDSRRLAGLLHGFLEGEVESRRLSREYFEAVREKKILHFLESSLAFRLWSAQRAGKLYREQPFVMGISARRLGEEFPEEEKVLIQGIIDVFFEEEDGLVLLDYKTDTVKTGGELWNRYETQMDYYQEAVERLMKRRVKEKLLYSFHLEETVEG